MDGAVETRSGGFNSDGTGSAAAHGRRVINNPVRHATRGLGGEPRYKILPPGGGVLRGSFSSPPSVLTTDRESLSRGRRETTMPLNLERRSYDTPSQDLKPPRAGDKPGKTPRIEARPGNSGALRRGARGRGYGRQAQGVLGGNSGFLCGRGIGSECSIQGIELLWGIG
jgi:hypothetical protein